MFSNLIYFNKEKYSYPDPDKLQEKLSSISSISASDDNKYVVFPGFCDIHVHLREPGFSYKEKISTGTAAAAHGGYTAVCTMPNLNPVPDNLPHLNEELKIIDKDALIKVYPYASITVGELGCELSDFDALAGHVIAFSDDGRGVQTEGLMREAMLKAKSLGKIIVAHCEVNDLLNGGYIHAGYYARKNNHLGISSESEWKQVERDIKLADETGASYHVCHISTKESVEIIRDAKMSGVDVSCETAPHYLVFTDSDLKEDGRWKMNPPLRSADDRKALIQGIIDGTIDCIATDHAPHRDDEKSRGLKNSAFGISGIETAFPILYTELVMKKIIPLDRLIELINDNPRKRFGIPSLNDYSVWDISSKYKIDSSKFISMGHSTPFEGMEVFGRCLLTVCDGKTVYKIK